MKLVFQAHLADECPKLPLPCPNKCDKKLEIPRDEVLVLFSITLLKSPRLRLRSHKLKTDSYLNQLVLHSLAYLHHLRVDYELTT